MSAMPAAVESLGMGQVASIVRPWRGTLSLVAILVICSALLELVPPLLIRVIVDDHLTAGRAEGLPMLALLYLAATAAIHGTSALATYLSSVAAQGGLHDLRMRLFRHLQALPIRYYDETPIGDAISRCTADVEAVDTLFSSGVAQVVADLVRLATVAMAMFALSLPLAVVSSLVAPPLAFATRQLQIRVRAAARAHRENFGLLNAHLQEILSGVEVIRAFDRHAQFVRRFRAALALVLDSHNRSTLYAALYPTTTATLAAIATALLLWAGTGPHFASWNISIGTLTAFVLLFQRFFKPIIALGNEWQTVQTALSGAERIFQVLALPVERRAAGSTAEQPAGDGRVSRAVDGRRPDEGAVELDRVTFGYHRGRPVLHEVSLVVHAGEHVALVGRTGAGKSSALALLGGIYTPWSGAVRVAGRDPTALAPEERRALLGVVPQLVQLFGGTVLDNLTLYDPSVPLEAVRRAAAVTGADAFVQALPDGYATPLSGTGRGSGVQLSAGQLQLLALTRALVRDPPVLLLDEATVAIDSASDAAFRAALRRGALQRGCAVLTVAHRLATAREADRVVVLEAGRVVEAGPPDDLIARGGRFAALVELEAAGWDWRGASDGR